MGSRKNVKKLSIFSLCICVKFLEALKAATVDVFRKGLTFGGQGLSEEWAHWGGLLTFNFVLARCVCLEFIYIIPSQQNRLIFKFWN